MTDARDQSYYEIALTNRQVMGIFVVLLACVAVAFFSGVWLGRGAGGPRVATVEAQAIEAGVGPGDAPLAELEFFRRDETEPAAALDAKAEVEVAASPRVEPPPVIIEEIGEPAPEASTPPPRSDTRSADSEPVARTGAAAGEPLPLVVQVFSTTDIEQAEQVLERLQKAGYPARLSPVDVDGRPMYRVRIGPYEQRDEATKVAERVRKDFKLDTWITR